MPTFTPKVVTANDLLTGDVIYLAADGRWVRHINAAKLIEDQDQANVLLSEASTQAQIAVGPYLADATIGPNGPTPTHFREVFRRDGPTNYPTQSAAA